MWYFHNYESFVAMGGYAIYVWPAFIIAIAMLLSNVFLARRHLRRMLNKIRKRDANSS